eukprot:EC715171.1.p1 GENE.EC715171.1~~EC715171.1.p1  ORF type:complete len:71 (-),score=0.63 EC715171.1:22-234(-)
MTHACRLAWVMNTAAAAWRAARRTLAGANDTAAHMHYGALHRTTAAPAMAGVSTADDPGGGGQQFVPVEY